MFQTWLRLRETNRCSKELRLAVLLLLSRAESGTGKEGRETKGLGGGRSTPHTPDLAQAERDQWTVQIRSSWPRIPIEFCILPSDFLRDNSRSFVRRDLSLAFVVSLSCGSDVDVLQFFLPQLTFP